MTEQENNIRNALNDIDAALKEPYNYDEPDIEEIRALQQSLRARLCELKQEQEVEHVRPQQGH